MSVDRGTFLLHPGLHLSLWCLVVWFLPELAKVNIFTYLQCVDFLKSRKDTIVPFLSSNVFHYFYYYVFIFILNAGADKCLKNWVRLLFLLNIKITSEILLYCHSTVCALWNYHRLWKVKICQVQVMQSGQMNSPPTVISFIGCLQAGVSTPQGQDRQADRDLTLYNTCHLSRWLLLILLISASLSLDISHCFVFTVCMWQINNVFSKHDRCILVLLQSQSRINAL